MDYLEYFGLKEQPFSNVVDNRFYFKSSQHEQALIKLKYAIDTRKGLSVVVGEIGAGKTTLARKLLEELDEAKYEATLLVIIHSSVSSEWLLRKFAIQLGLETENTDKLGLLSLLFKKLLEINESGRTVVLLMDEVQMLRSTEIMEEFRGLLNMEMPEGKMLNLVFFGLGDLDDVLSLDEPLKQRVAMKLTLRPFSEEDTRDYILHRLKTAGAGTDIFSESAITEIFRYSSGIPRLINTICDNALLEAYLFKTREVGESVIKAVAIDLGLNSQ